MRLFAERMDSLADPLDPGFGFDMIRLAVPRLEALGASQLKLEGGAVKDAAIDELADRLAPRLGRGRVRRLRPPDTPIPEQAQQTSSASFTARVCTYSYISQSPLSQQKNKKKPN